MNFTINEYGLAAMMLGPCHLLISLLGFMTPKDVRAAFFMGVTWAMLMAYPIMFVVFHFLFKGLTQVPS